MKRNTSETTAAGNEVWSVTVNVSGEDVLTIAHDHVAGPDNVNDFAPVIRTAAAHLMSFIGTGEDANGRIVGLACPEEGQTLILDARTSESTRYPFCLHAGELAHTLIVGPVRSMGGGFPGEVHAAPVVPAAVNPEHVGKHALVLTGAQLLEALDFIAPDRDTDPEQMEAEVTIGYGEGHAGKALYVWCADCPEEGSFVLDGKSDAAAHSKRPLSWPAAIDLHEAFTTPPALPDINECTEALEDAISRLDEMKDILNDGAHDSPQTFLEFAHDAQDRINRAVMLALKPLLNLKQ